MSIVHIGHIQKAVDSRFRDLIDLSDVATFQEPQREDCFLTRGLAAFVIAQLSGAPDAVAAASVVDGFGDNGLDALYFDVSERVCYLLQSKWSKSGSGAIDLGSALKFKKGVHDFFQGDLDQFGPKINARKTEILDILGDSQNTFVLVVAHTGQDAVHPTVLDPLEELIQILNDPTELISLRVLNQAELHSILAKGALGEAIDLQIMLKEFGMVREPFAAYYGQVDLKDVATWGKYGSYLTAKNLRGFKGSTDVNDGIIHTIRNSPQNFWYFNNGITIVASKVTAQALGSGTNESRVFECQGASVVNGAQTMGSIVSALSGGGNGLQNARVLVRIISLEDCPETFERDLTKATNFQNRIESKDFVAQDPQQSRLQTDLILSNGKRYSYRSGEAHPTPNEGLIFEDAAVALACAHSDISNSVQAKREVGKLWEDINKAPYKTLFNPSTSALRMWNAVEIMRAVEAYLRVCQSASEGKAKLIATHGNRFVLHMVFQSGVDPNSSDLEASLKLIPETVTGILAQLIAATLKLYKDSYPSNLFKNQTKCRELAKEMRASSAIVVSDSTRAEAQ